MHLFADYIAYLKDNPEGYWFKRKLYGFGWVPARWQGWTTLFVYVAFVIWLSLSVPADVSDETAVAYVLGPILGATLLLLAISWRTGEPLRWQWGKRTLRNK